VPDFHCLQTLAFDPSWRVGVVVSTVVALEGSCWCAVSAEVVQPVVSVALVVVWMLVLVEVLVVVVEVE